MNKFAALATLLLAFDQAEAHSHPGIDSLTHSLEHLALMHPTGIPYPLGLGLIMLAALALLIWQIRRPQ